MLNTLRKLRQKSLSNILQFKFRSSLHKHHQYLRIFMKDRRWLLMFVLARFPLGRAMAQTFYSNLIGWSKKANPENTFARDNESSIFKDLDIELAGRSSKMATF